MSLDARGSSQVWSARDSRGRVIRLGGTGSYEDITDRVVRRTDEIARRDYTFRRETCRVEPGRPAENRGVTHGTVQFPESGGFLLHRRDRTFFVDPTAIVVHAPFVAHGVSDPFGLAASSWSLAMDDALFRRLAGDGPRVLRPLVLRPSARTLLLQQALLRELRAGEMAASDHVAQRVLDSVGADLGRVEKDGEGRISEGQWEALFRAQAYLVAHFRERISLPQIARAAYASPFHLARLFRRAHGHTVREHLSMLRLRAALDDLRGEADVASVAHGLGLRSHSHFSKIFRAHFGIHPSSYRRLMGARSSRMLAGLDPTSTAAR